MLDQRRFLALRGGKNEGLHEQQTRHVCLELSGLSCASCVAKAERALLSVDGVLEVRDYIPPTRSLSMLSVHSTALKVERQR